MKLFQSSTRKTSKYISLKTLGTTLVCDFITKCLVKCAYNIETQVAYKQKSYNTCDLMCIFSSKIIYRHLTHCFTLWINSKRILTCYLNITPFFIPKISQSDPDNVLCKMISHQSHYKCSIILSVLSTIYIWINNRENNPTKQTSRITFKYGRRRRCSCSHFAAKYCFLWNELANQTAPTRISMGLVLVNTNYMASITFQFDKIRSNI